MYKLMQNRSEEQIKGGLESKNPHKSHDPSPHHNFIHRCLDLLHILEKGFKE
jgi:hypothetical protein